MKNRINNIVDNAVEAGEVDLFRAMQRILSENGHRCVYCEVVHQRYVSFIWKRTIKRRREIADLLLVTLNRTSKKVRVSFLQAKRYRRKVLSAPIYHFTGDFGQFYLLSQRPTLLSGLPPCTLTFSPAESLTTYGVFYNDKNGRVDLFYVAADRLTTNSHSQRLVQLDFDTNKHGPLTVSHEYNYQGDSYSESVAIDGIDKFEHDLLAWKIGAVIPDCWTQTFLNRVFCILLNHEKKKKFPLEQKQNLFTLANDYGGWNHEVSIDDTANDDHVSFSSIMVVECDSECTAERRSQKIDWGYAGLYTDHDIVGLVLRPGELERHMGNLVLCYFLNCSGFSISSKARSLDP